VSVRGVGIFSTRNTIMNIRALILSAASIAALSPAVSFASPENAALDACARAFAASTAAPGSGAPAFKLKYHSSQAGNSILDYYGSHEYTFYPQALDLKTGATLARATCTTDMRGTQVALAAMPLNGSEATLAAR
jgi:hypothetical protein